MPTALTPQSVAHPAHRPRLDPARFDPGARRRLSAPGLRTFLAIADLWGLSEEERLRVLGLPARSTYYNWVRTVREHRDLTLDLDVLIRLSAVLGVHQALTVLHEDEGAAVEWLRSPHKALVFGGAAPIALLTCGTQDGLLTVRRFLDAARGGLFMAPNAVDAGFEGYTDGDLVWS